MVAGSVEGALRLSSAFGKAFLFFLVVGGGGVLVVASVVHGYHVHHCGVYGHVLSFPAAVAMRIIVAALLAEGKCRVNGC